jgi:hypothetical protein
MAVMTKRNGVLGWEFHQTYIDGTNQEAIELPFQPHGYSIQITPVGGTARWEASNDMVNWIQWNDGLIAISTASFMVPMRYGRVVHGSATSSTIAIWGQE